MSMIAKAESCTPDDVFVVRERPARFRVEQTCEESMKAKSTPQVASLEHAPCNAVSGFVQKPVHEAMTLRFRDTLERNRRATKD